MFTCAKWCAYLPEEPGPKQLYPFSAMPITALEHLATGLKTRSLLLIMLFRCCILSRMHPKVFTNTSLSIMLHALLIFASLTVACAIPIEAAGQVYLTYSGEVKFKSDAPLELITAASNQLRGAIDTEKRTFAFSIEMNTFEGFNSPLQREHFKLNCILKLEKRFVNSVVFLVRDVTYL